MNLKHLKYILTFTFTVLGLWAFYFEQNFGLKVKNYQLDVKNLNRSLKVVVLADLHIGSPYNGLNRLKKIVELSNKEHPDLILIPGDLIGQRVVGGSFVSPKDFVPILKQLKAKLGVFTVLGNHDHWHDPVEITSVFEKSGLKVLTNSSIEFPTFYLVGLDDQMAGQPDIKAALKNTKIGDKPIILFTHNPDSFTTIPKRVNLTIAGHTHGGQVYFPLIGRPIVPSKYGERFAIGHIIEHGQDLFVSSGVGTSILPVRFLVPPEISVLNLQGTN